MNYDYESPPTNSTPNGGGGTLPFYSIIIPTLLPHLPNLTLLLLFLQISFLPNKACKILGIIYSALNITLQLPLPLGVSSDHQQTEMQNQTTTPNLVFNCIFLVLNAASLGITLMQWLRGKCRGREGREMEKIYNTLFLPLHVTKGQFNWILKSKRSIKTFKAGEHYATEKKTRVDSLGLLITGKLLVTQSTRPLHLIQPSQFIDSPEYFGVSTDDLFQVSITATEESRVLLWHRDKLRLKLSEDAFLQEMFDHVIGRDVVRKLIQVTDAVPWTKETPENEPLCADKSMESEIWSLSKIAEEETIV